MRKINYLMLLLLGTLIFSCNQKAKKEMSMEDYEKGTFGYDLNYLAKKDTTIKVLIGDKGQSQIVISPKYQGKVFTSSADGLNGISFGYLNYKVLDSDVIDEHMNGYGGENRFWLGPEGGKYSVYFEPGKDQAFENWHTPKPIDTEPWQVSTFQQTSVSLKKEMEITNYLGNKLKLRVDRNITLVERPEIEYGLSIKLNPGVKAVAYMTDNTILNLNDFEWTKETGTVCIWMLDMYHPAPHALTFIPFNEGNEAELGKVVTSDYFGEIPSDRLKIQDNVIYLKTDGKYRSKLGVNGKRTKAIAGNYDPDAKRLTITTFNVEKDATYLNQEWNPTKDPLIGDAMNAYNDGPLDDGSIMGPFLELESVSPAAFLKPMSYMTHKHSVYHFVGEDADLSPITQKLFGVSIDQLKTVFK